MTQLLLYFFVAIIFSFYCSLLESSLLCTTHAHVGLMVKRGWKSGRLFRDLKRRIDRPLAAILALNTVSNMVGATGVGAQTQILVAQSSQESVASASTWIALSSGILTFCVLVFSEIIPKKLGAVYWTRLAPFTAYSVKILIIATYPLVIFLEFVARRVAPNVSPDHVTREEVLVVAELGETEGTLHRGETRVIRNLLTLSKISVQEILTPRAVTKTFQEGRTIGEVMGETNPIPFSRIPIHGKDLDDIVGYVFRLRILEAHSKGERSQKLSELCHPIHAVPASQSVAKVMEEFITRREHLFLVVDEYGGTRGIVTLEDAIETLLGVEIVDESDAVEDMRVHARQLWEKRKRDLARGGENP